MSLAFLETSVNDQSANQLISDNLDIIYKTTEMVDDMCSGYGSFANNHVAFYLDTNSILETYTNMKNAVSEALEVVFSEIGVVISDPTLDHQSKLNVISSIVISESAPSDAIEKASDTIYTWQKTALDAMTPKDDFQIPKIADKVSNDLLGPIKDVSDKTSDDASKVINTIIGKLDHVVKTTEKEINAIADSSSDFVNSALGSAMGVVHSMVETLKTAWHSTSISTIRSGDVLDTAQYVSSIVGIVIVLLIIGAWIAVSVASKEAANGNFRKSAKAIKRAMSKFKDAVMMHRQVYK